MPAVNDYALELQTLLRREDKLEVDVDISGNTMQKKIRTGQLSQYNFIFGKSLFQFLTHGDLIVYSCRCPGKGVTLSQHPQPRRPSDPEQGRHGAARGSSGEASGIA